MTGSDEGDARICSYNGRESRRTWPFLGVAAGRLKTDNSDGRRWQYLAPILGLASTLPHYHLTHLHILIKVARAEVDLGSNNPKSMTTGSNEGDVRICSYNGQESRRTWPFLGAAASCLKTNDSDDRRWVGYGFVRQRG
jgi:hypothetical protein